MEKLLRQFRLSHIQIRVTLRNVNAQAFPDSLHPIIAARREAGFAAAADSDGNISLTQARKITEEASAAPLVTVNAATLEEALEALRVELKARRRKKARA